MKPRGRRATWSLPLVALLCAGLVGGALLVRGGDASQAPDARPNIVMIIDDDQTAEQQRFLGRTNAEIGGHGVTFDNSFVSFSLCCPSRATLMTGQYAHNHGVLGDEPPAGGYSKLAPTLGNTLPVWLQRSGYYTGLVGKFLNHYGSADPHAVPPGWNQWYGTLDNPHLSPDGYYASYGYTLNENGSIVHYGTTPRAVDPPAYQTNVFSRLADAFIRRRASSDQPFFLYIAPRDPHVEPTSCNCEGDNPRPPPGYAGRFKGLKAPRTPAFNEADVSDKPPEIRNRPRLTPHQEAEVDALYRAQARTLLGVDDLVANVVRTLRQEGKLDNTVILFTSDNGFLHGEHRVSQGKVLPYEPSIRVPLLIRAPGLPEGVHRRQPVVNADLAPTILDFAHAEPGRVEDGQSLIPIMRNPLYWPGRGIDLEAWGNPVKHSQNSTPPPRLQGRAHRPLHVRGLRRRAAGLYDLRKDPYELQNAASTRPTRASVPRWRGCSACSRSAPARPAGRGLT